MPLARRHNSASCCPTPPSVASTSVSCKHVRRQSERLIAPHGDRSEGKPRLGGVSLALNSVRALELPFSQLSITVFRLRVPTVIQ